MTISANTRTSRNEIAAGGEDASFVEVETSCGRLRGQETKGIKVWKGIHYGATTAGENRFLPPRKPATWTGVRDALVFGQTAPQPTAVTSEYGKLIGWDKQPSALGEDCLVLNVWTPGVGDGAKRTVMVSLHGGGFTSGSGSTAGYDGASLARFGDVVVVTINHRLGALGYLHLADLGAPAEFAQSGAAGMLDIALALEWVRDNAERFGGDPNSVMVWGQSGGGAKTSTLLAMPAAQGLFKRAAIQSGSVLRLTPRDVASQLAERLLAKLGLDKSGIAELQAIPFERLIAAQGALSPDMPMLGFAPVVDGTAIPCHPFEPTAPAISADIPIIVGTTLDEAAMVGRQDISDADIKARLLERYGANTARIIDSYRKRWPAASPFLLQARINTDRDWRHAANTMVERKAAQGRAPAYLYQFNWPSPAAGGKFGAVHGIDVSLAFNNGRGALAGDTEESRALAERFASAWVAFAKSGDPNTPALPRWEPFNAQTRPTMVFDHEIALENDPFRELRTLWGELRSSRPA
jgi:para-nitrobenzyl esterase